LFLTVFGLSVSVCIHTELATVVDSQDEDIHQMESMAIETLGSASAGLSFLVKIQHEAASRAKKRRQFLVALSTAILVIAVFHWVVDAIVQDKDGTPNGP
jgi:arginine deiminase